MGLDMNMYKRTGVKNYSFMKDEDKSTVTVTGAKAKDIKSERIESVTEEIMYWRKANQIHNWIIENVGDDENGSNEVVLNEDNLRELLDVCTKVIDGSKLVPGKIKNGQRGTPTGWEDIIEDGLTIEDATVAMELLPTGSGFFFGSTEYDKYYLDDVIRTKDFLEALLQEDLSDSVIFYSSSW